MSDYRVLVKVQNARIFERIKNAGFKNVSHFCKHYSLNQTDVGKLLNLKMSPVNKAHKFIPIVLRLADALNALPDDLFTERQYEPIPENVKDFLMQENEILQLMNTGGNSEHKFALIEMAQKIQDRAGLTPREQKVIDMRFREELTYVEISEEFDLSVERIRQIEAKALRKMRSPSVRGDMLSSDIVE